MTQTSHAAFKAMILDPERQDAEAKLANSAYWGDTGMWVSRAVAYASMAMNRVPADGPQVSRAWVARVICELQEAVSDFRSEEDDPDGYGIATLHGCVRRAQEWRG